MRAIIVKAATAVAILAIAGLSVPAAASRWASETENDLGLSYSYPTDVFSRAESDGKAYFRYFASKSSDAKFLVGGWNNAKGQSPGRI